MKNASQKDLAPQRWERLLDLINRQGVMRVNDFCRELGVSPATVRRDLEQLEKRGELKRVHGGAVGAEKRLDEPVFDEKAAIAADEKSRIAKVAAGFVQAHDTIYLDGGSTILQLARQLKDREDITVVTHSLRAALELAGGGPRLILIGGELRRISQTMVGPLTQALLQELHVDKAFMGTIGLTLQEGMTTTDPGEAYTKKLVMQRAREVYLLADGSKEGKVSFARAGGLEKLDVMVSDNSLSARFIKEVEKMGVNLILA